LQFMQKKQQHMFKTIIGHIILLLLLWISLTPAADTKLEIDSLFVEQDQLYINFHINNLLEKKTIEGLQRGFTSQIEHQVRLWKTTKLVSSIEAEVSHTIIIYYDSWENKFAIVRENEKRLTGNVDRLTDQCSNVTGLYLTLTTKLNAESKYYISIQSSFQPMSDEAYNDLREWMSQKPDKTSENKTPKKRGRILGVFLDLMGFGDSNIICKSRDFYIRNNSEIEFVN
jgi:hypothetical protein